METEMSTALSLIGQETSEIALLTVGSLICNLWHNVICQ